MDDLHLENGGFPYSYLKLPERNKLCRPCGVSSGRQRPETCQYIYICHMSEIF